MRFLTAAAVLLATVSWASPGLSQWRQDQGKARPPIGYNPHPLGGSTTKPPARPASPAKKDSTPRRDHAGRDTGHGGCDSDSHHVPYFGNRFVYGYPRGYGYDPYGYPYGCDYGYGVPYYYPVPVFVPALPAYGPQAVQGFLGMGGGGAAAPAAGDGGGDEPPPARVLDRRLNANGNAKAWKLIGGGDALFAKAKYVVAGDYYRRATSAMPLLADAWIRRALAQVAIGNYDLAIVSVKRGLKADPAWPKTRFDGVESLWTNDEAKKQYFAKLVKLAAEKPADADVQFLVGLHFHIDGQEEPAQKYFARAQRLAGDGAEHIEAFVTAAP
jgi:hypothetical protein